MSDPDAISAALPAFASAPGLGGGHLQTLWGPLTRSRRRTAFRRESLTTPDGDELIVDHVDGPPGSPRTILLHGLEGSSYSVYVQGMASLLAAAGGRVAAMNFRSCARDPGRRSRMIPNRRARLYHSGETSDLDFLVRTLREREPGAPLRAIGVSVGGNVLLKWLGESPESPKVDAAVALSTPYDLAASARFMESPMGRFYTARFLRTLKFKAREAVRRFPDAASKIDLRRSEAARTFWEFDDAANAPLHGFAGADDYYDRASAIRYLHGIAVPTLCLSAEDDPFLPRRTLHEARAAASPSVDFRITPHGGHIGWVSGYPWRPDYWAERFSLAWLGSALKS